MEAPKKTTPEPRPPTPEPIALPKRTDELDKTNQFCKLGSPAAVGWLNKIEVYLYQR